MSTKTNTLAKSLHTITALVRVAQLVTEVARDHVSRPYDLPPEDAMSAALEALGYAGAADPYGLAAKALAIVKAEAVDRAAQPELIDA